MKKYFYVITFSIITLNIVIFTNKSVSAEQPAAYKLVEGTGCPKDCGSGNYWYGCYTEGSGCSKYVTCECFTIIEV